MIVADLPMEELARRLTGPGLPVRTGPLLTRIQSPLPAVVQGVGLHYSHHTIADELDFCDFHVRVAAPRSLRRWFAPQVHFHVDGNPPFLPLPLEQAFPMLEWGLNWCVSSHCHQYLIIHAAVVEHSGRALLLPAPPGAGKSTLCAGLISRGWRLLSDELALIDPGTGNLVPLPRPVSLKNRSIDVIRDFAQDAAFSAIVRDTTKGSVAHMRPPAKHVVRSKEEARPGWIVIPRYRPEARASLTPLPKARAFMQLADNAFNYALHGRTGFDLLARIVDACSCYEFTYSSLDEAILVFHGLVHL